MSTERELRTFSTETPMTDDQWMLIESRMENAWAEALSDYADEDEAEPTTYRQTACAVCGQDIEGQVGGDEWRDRGNGTECLPYRNREGESVTPTGKHRPVKEAR